MADSILRLKVESQEYDAKLKQAAEGLTRYAEQCRKAGESLEYVEKETLDYVRALGEMDATSRTVNGKMAEMKKAFVEISAQYRQMTDAEKASPFGKALADSLDTLKGRIQDSKAQLESINREMSDSKFGQFGGMIDSIGQKMGINANLTELLTSKTALMSAGIGASVAIIGKATEEWAKYNSELAKQDQITTVTTGVKGPGADRMTDQARSLVDTYNVDFREAINAANTLMTQFGKSGEEAMDLIRQGMQGMIQGDGPKLLSMIQQYAPSFRDAGIEASQLVAIIQNSEGGIFTDQNMNAIVMGIKNIRLMTKATSDALAQLGIDGQKMSKDLSAGTITIFDAMKQVMDQLQKVESGSQTAGEVMQQVFGRQGAAAGTNLAKAIATLNTNLEETKLQTGEVGQSYDDLYEANVKLNQAIRDCFEYDGWEQMATGIKAKLVTALANVLDFTSKIKDSWVGDVGRTIFDTMTNAALKASGALGTVLSLLKNINSERGKGNGGNNGGIGTSDIDKALQYIGNGANQQERETRYDKIIAQLRQKLDNIGKERRVNNADGSVSYKIDSQDVQDQKRAALERRISILEKQRDSVVNKPDTSPVKPVKPLPPTKPTKTTSTTTTHQTPQQRAQESFTKAEQNYKQALEQAAMELQAGTITRAEAKKKEMQAAEQRWKAIGDARNISDSPELKQAQNEAATNYKALAAEVKTATERQKAIDKATRDLENANQKLATARTEMAQAKHQGDLQAYNTAKDKATAAQQEITRLEKVKVNVETGKVELPDIPKVIEQTVNTHQGELMTAEIAKEITQTINTRLGRIVTPEILESITQTINTKIGRVVTPAIAKELTQVVNVETGKVELPDIPKVIEQTVNTHQGEMMTAEIAEEITQTINTRLGRIVTPEILESITQTINTKIGRVVTPAIAKELTQVVNVETGKVDLPDIPTEITQTVDFLANTRNIDAAISYVKKEMDTIPVGTIEFNIDQTKLADLTTLKTLITEQVKNGLQIDPNFAQSMFKNIQAGKDIENTTWQAQVDNINKNRTTNGRTPLKINYKTGEKENDKEKEKKTTSKETLQGIQTMVGSLQSIAGGINQLGIELPQELTSIFGVLQTITGIVGAIQSMQTVGSFLGLFANGGVVGKAAGGMLIPGNSFSGDNIYAGNAWVNAGELVLNKAQQSTLASRLQNDGGQQQQGAQPFVTGEVIYLGLQNYLRANGYGQIVTTRNNK